MALHTLQTFNFYCSYFSCLSFKDFCKFLRVLNSAWDFWGVNFCSRDFLGVLLEAWGISLGFDVCPHSIIPIIWNPEYLQPWGEGEFIHKRRLFDISYMHAWPMRWASFWGRRVIGAWVYSRKYSNCLKSGNMNIKVLYMIHWDSIKLYTIIEVTQGRC